MEGTLPPDAGGANAAGKRDPAVPILGRVLHIGTDEAGYGPLLGPLVVAGAVFDGRPRRRAEIDDSKVVYARGGRDALAAALGPYLRARGPVRLSALLEAHSVRGDPRDAYAWYGDVEDPVPAPGAAPRGFRRLLVNPVCEREFNAGCGEWGGKAGVLFRETCRVVRSALAAFPEGDADVVCDKHGGRNRYAALLMAEFRPASLITERETAARSSYRMQLGGRSVRIRFVRRADGSDGAVALASMAAKYVRELFMQGFNEFFRARLDGLRPTAGYYGDGRRFLSDVEPVLGDLGGRDALVRVR